MKPPRKNKLTRRIIVAGQREAPTVREMAAKSKPLLQYAMHPLAHDMSHPSGPILPARVNSLASDRTSFTHTFDTGDYVHRSMSYTCEAHVDMDAAAPFLRGLLQGLPVRLQISNFREPSGEFENLAWFLSGLKVHAVNHQTLAGRQNVIVMGYILDLYT